MRPDYRTAFVAMALALVTAAFVPLSLGQERGIPLLAGKTFRSVVMIVTSDAGGQPLALGSGFFVAPGLVATNMHVIEGASAAAAKIVGRPQTFVVAGVVGTDPIADLALLRIKGTEAPPIELEQDKQAAVGDEVFAVGNPEGLEGTFSEGIISGIRTIDKNTLLQMTAPISPGSSGGPVIDPTGRVLGVAVATFKEGQNLNFAVPISYLRALIARSTGEVVTPLAKVAPQSSSDSMVAQMGSSATIGVTGDKFMWNNDTCNGEYSFTLTNHLDQPIQRVEGYVIFHAEDGTVVDADRFLTDFSDEGDLPPSLAKRMAHMSVDPSVELETTNHDRNNYECESQPSTKVEFRILDFELGQ